MKPLPWGCPESVTGHSEGSRRDGRCTWCGQKFDSVAPKPDSFAVSEATEWYEIHYNPDWDGGSRD